MEVRRYGKHRDPIEVPNLVKLQTESYATFLQKDVEPGQRKEVGLEALLRETFPIVSYDKTMQLEYLGYEFSPPRHSPEECRRLRLTYGYPLKVRLRLVKAEPVEEDVYLGEIPVMLGGGEFIINGAERVIVNQLHRSPGVDFSEETILGEKKLHSCRIIPERGSWIAMGVTKKDSLQVRIDESGKFSAMTLLRAMDPGLGRDEDIIRTFYPTKVIKRKKSDPDAKFIQAITGKIPVGVTIAKDGEVWLGTILSPEGEPILRTDWRPLTPGQAEAVVAAGVKELEVIDLDLKQGDWIILNALREDPLHQPRSHEDSLLKIYARLRPGNPPHPEKARELFHERFFDPTRYRLGRVGRFRINRKFDPKRYQKYGVVFEEVGMDVQVLTPEDFVNCIRYLLLLRAGKGEVDDIDHLGSRRVRTIAELAGEEIRKGLIKLKKTATERMNSEDAENQNPRYMVNSKAFSSAVDYFFGRGELSQVVDQTNPLSQLTHERRLSALGPGGLNRKRAGFDVRDVHSSHYGRLCPVETPEGTNIGLISSLAIYAGVDDYGFLITPYRVVRNGKVTKEIRWLRADEEFDHVLAPADIEIDLKGNIVQEKVQARVRGDFTIVERREVDFIDVSPKQIVGISAGLIPFLEHDDANRALMGSNMQRQAVPLIQTEPPIVGTGMEKVVAKYSGMVVRAKRGGVVKYVDAEKIVVGEDTYKLRKFQKLNERTCLNQKPVVKEGDKVKAGDVIADGAGTHQGILSLGRNLLVAFMVWDGYNFEDAILLSERLVKEDILTSIHIDEFEIEIRETKLGREEFTRDIPNASEKALQNLDETGIVRIGTRVKAGDILVGKVAPKAKSELSPEEKLLHAIFGRAGEDVKNASLEVPLGVEGIVIDAQKFSRKVNLTPQERQQNLDKIRDAEREFIQVYRDNMKKLIKELEKILKKKIKDDLTQKPVVITDESGYTDLKRARELAGAAVEGITSRTDKKKALEIYRDFCDRIDSKENEKNKLVNRVSRGDDLPTGVLEMVKVYVATKRRISVGDKMAGRHGNKGVVSRIVPVEDMPFLEDGTPVDIVLNPLGVPSRMNVGQILETHLGWAAHEVGFRAECPVFDGATEKDIEEALKEAGLPPTGKAVRYDGRTGEPFDQEVTVGYIYMLKLHHLVDDKVHARATGPYSLITQQPLGGKARFGGQRFGEMEVWALEAYGAASILQELLTVKSDDVDGRTKIYESMVKGENILEPGMPVSFGVLMNEIRGLCLNMELIRKGSAQELMGS